MTTMTTVEFLTHLRGMNVRVRRSNGHLRLSAPDGVLTPELRAELARRKAEIMAFLQKAQNVANFPTPLIPSVSQEGNLPLSFAQQRMWFLDQLTPGNPFYNIPNVVRMSGQLDVTALAQGLGEVIRRHQVLRTTFPALDGRPVQVIIPALRQSLPIVDLCTLPECQREAQMRQLAAEEALHPFDLAHGPLVRSVLLKLAPGQHVLLLTLHHIVSDGWSGSVLIRDLMVLYQAFTAGKSSPLPELPIQYSDFAVWQRAWLQGDVLKEQLVYWRQQLDVTADVVDLPADRPRRPTQIARGASLSFSLPKSLSEALKALSQQEGVTCLPPC